MRVDESRRRSEHWNDVYDRNGEDQLSWFESEPSFSLALVDALGVTPEQSVIDIGGGAARLVDALLCRGFRDLSVLDVSSQALRLARDRLGAAGTPVEWIEADVLRWQQTRSYDVWHDRAVFHFLVSPADRTIYRRLLHRVVPVNGCVVVATFAADGPERCSGLPVQRYGPDQLMQALGPGLEPVAVRREEHRTPAQTMQPFTWVAARRRS
jgi:SAM-dependent methyltransferase